MGVFEMNIHQLDDINCAGWYDEGFRLGFQSLQSQVAFLKGIAAGLDYMLNPSSIYNEVMQQPETQYLPLVMEKYSSSIKPEPLIDCST